MLLVLLGYSDVEANGMRGGIHLYWNNILIIPFFCVFAIKDGVIGVANVSTLHSCLPAHSSCLTPTRIACGTGGLPFGESREGALRDGRYARTALELHVDRAEAAGAKIRRWNFENKNLEIKI